jgi:hypothetical protein
MDDIILYASINNLRKQQQKQQTIVNNIHPPKSNNIGDVEIDKRKKKQQIIDNRIIDFLLNQTDQPNKPNQPNQPQLTRTSHLSIQQFRPHPQSQPQPQSQSLGNKWDVIPQRPNIVYLNGLFGPKFRNDILRDLIRIGLSVRLNENTHEFDIIDKNKRIIKDNIVADELNLENDDIIHFRKNELVALHYKYQKATEDQQETERLYEDASFNAFHQTMNEYNSFVSTLKDHGLFIQHDPETDQFMILRTGEGRGHGLRSKQVSQEIGEDDNKIKRLISHDIPNRYKVILKLNYEDMVNDDVDNDDDSRLDDSFHQSQPQSYPQSQPQQIPQTLPNFVMSAIPENNEGLLNQVNATLKAFDNQLQGHHPQLFSDIKVPVRSRSSPRRLSVLSPSPIRVQQSTVGDLMDIESSILQIDPENPNQISNITNNLKQIMQQPQTQPPDPQPQTQPPNPQPQTQPPDPTITNLIIQQTQDQNVIGNNP